MATAGKKSADARSNRSLVIVALFVLAGCSHQGAGDLASNAAAKPSLESNDTPSLPSADAQPRPSKTQGVPPGPSLQTDDTPSELSISHESASAVHTGPPKTVQPVYRPSDARGRHDDRRLAELGIHKYESKRLKLYTDIDPQLAKPLPALLDLAYEAWEDYLGKLPPDREGTPFQITGYLMSDKELFRRAGLLPADLRAFVNGRHRGAEFWMIDQEHDYYRRHLMIHEATHCFMTIMPDTRAPVWYLEGVAEQFGTHYIDAEGTVHFRVMPHRKQDFAGLGRITMIQLSVQKGRFKSLDEVFRLKPNDYLENEAYAWSWAVCEFLGKHPRYRDRFRQLSRHLRGTQFETAFREFIDGNLPDLQTEWPLFAHHLRHGYDHQRAAIEFQAGKPLAVGSGSRRIEISADRGWQSSGLLVEQGREYQITASGRFTLAQEPIPWVSEPQGISFRYFDGRPLGMLLAAIRSKTPSDGSAAESMLKVIPIGRQNRLLAARTGTLYFRLNDLWSELKDNTGTVQIQIE